MTPTIMRCARPSRSDCNPRNPPSRWSLNIGRRRLSCSEQFA
jgi:hypothetical protein